MFHIFPVFLRFCEHRLVYQQLPAAPGSKPTPNPVETSKATIPGERTTAAQNEVAGKIAESPEKKRTVLQKVVGGGQKVAGMTRTLIDAKNYPLDMLYMMKDDFIGIVFGSVASFLAKLVENTIVDPKLSIEKLKQSILQLQKLRRLTAKQQKQLLKMKQNLSYLEQMKTQLEGGISQWLQKAGVAGVFPSFDGKVLRLSGDYAQIRDRVIPNIGLKGRWTKDKGAYEITVLDPQSLLASMQQARQDELIAQRDTQQPPTAPSQPPQPGQGAPPQFQSPMA